MPPGETCFSATTPTSGGSGGTGTGMVGLLGTITGGTGGTAGTYGGVSLTGGNGSLATANITVAGGAVTAVTILNPGSGYVVGDTLSAASGNIGGVSGFSVPVSSVAINSSLAGGTVGFYTPNTLVFKQTWQNAAQTVLNTNPVTLDANGCAIIYGAGTYRQILKDSVGNIIWDQLTASTDQGGCFWTGAAAGTPNAITVTAASFTGTDGQCLQFLASATNTGATTLNPSSFGNVPVVKDTSSGPVALAGGEIVDDNAITVVYSTTGSQFHLLNTISPSSTVQITPLCGASGLRITNDGASPSNGINLTADQIVMQTTTGFTITRSNVSLTSISILSGLVTSTANGMDGESPSNWLYIWAIDNGTTTAGLVSVAAGNGLSPSMPAGYTYKCRLGAMRFDGLSLYRTLQAGRDAQYTLVTAGNTTVYPTIASGSTASVMTAASVSTVLPATATKLRFTVNTPTSASVIFNPNNISGFVAGSQSVTAVTMPGTASVQMLSEFMLESTTVYYGSNAAGGGVFAVGWTDKVNAN